MSRKVLSHAIKRTLPKMFWTDGFFPFNLKRALVITDSALMQKAFKNPMLCARGSSSTVHVTFKFESQVYRVDEMASEAGFTKLMGKNVGLAGGEYDASHRLLRQKWHQTIMKMMSRNELENMIAHTGQQAVQNIQADMAKTPAGIDPKPIFMSAALNVVTSFLTSDQHEFGEPEQLKILETNVDFLTKINGYFAVNAYDSLFYKLLPKFIYQRGYHRKLLQAVMPNLLDGHDVVYKKLWPFLLRKLHEHESSMDPDCPRDYMDFLLNEHRTGDEIGVLSLIKTCLILYVAGGDTTATTMSWILSFLGRYTDVQQKCHNEIEHCIQLHGRPIEAEMPYVAAVIEETFRLRPIADTVPHVTNQNVELEGHFIPKGTIIFGQLLSPCMNPDVFVEPLKFDPERHIVDGVFKQNSHISRGIISQPFSVGLRDCPGKRIAKMEIFSFVCQIISAFIIAETDECDNFEIDSHMTVYQPRQTKLTFTERK